MRERLVLATFLMVLAGDPGPAGAAEATAVEVGRVDWKRDFEGALRESAASGRPVLAFFQEVPGCAGCRRFGAEVMSHALIVEAIEREFLPLLIYNNRPGADADLLERFGEPSWNYQVIRFLDGKGADLIPRRDRVWTVEALAFRMIDALVVAGRDVPAYLEVAAYENDTEHHATAVFAQPCFWTGELALGRIRGVIATEAGWVGDREVTRVRYHTGLVSLEALVTAAAASGAADEALLATAEERLRARRVGRLPVARLDAGYRAADAADQKRQIRDTPLATLELTPMQRTKVNSFAPDDLERALAWLSPEQRRRLPAS